MAESLVLLAGYSALADLFPKTSLTATEQQVVYTRRPKLEALLPTLGTHAATV